MKTSPTRYFEVLALAPRLAPAVPDTAGLRARRMDSGVRAFFATHEADWMALLRSPERSRRRTN